MRLQGKIGIVSAAASGMGRAGALRFAREGAAVGVADIDQAGVEAVVAEITAAGGRALALAGDLRQDSFAREIKTAYPRYAFQDGQGGIGRHGHVENDAMPAPVFRIRPAPERAASAR